MAKKLTKAAIQKLSQGGNSLHTNAVKEFTTNTGVIPQAVIHKNDLTLMVTEFDRFNLRNISLVSENKGSLRCDSAFSYFLEKRKRNTFTYRVTNAEYWSKGIFIGMFVGIALLICSTFLRPAVNAEKEKRIQLELAVVEANKALEGKSYENYPLGPYNICIDCYLAHHRWKQEVNAINAKADTVKTASDATIALMEKSHDQQRAMIANRIIHVTDSINAHAKQVSLSIRDSAEKIKDDKNPDMYKRMIKRSNLVFTAADSMILRANRADNETLLAMDKTFATKKQRFVDSVSTLITSIGQKAPRESDPYLYDLANIEAYYSIGPWFLWIVMLVLGVICTVLGIGMCIATANSMGKSEETNTDLTPENLRVMAFPGQTNSIQNNGECIIKTAMSPANREKLKSVLVRHNWNMIADDNAFDFADKDLRLKETVQPIYMNQAPQPLLYVEIGETVIIYAGVDTLPDNEEEAEQLIIKPIVEKIVDENNSNNGNGETSSKGDKKINRQL